MYHLERAFLKVITMFLNAGTFLQKHVASQLDAMHRAPPTPAPSYHYPASRDMPTNMFLPTATAVAFSTFPS